VAQRSKTTSIAKSATVATFATIVGYAATVAQQVLYARGLGIGSNTDALAVALAWAVATTGLVGTTLMSVVVPTYIAARHNHPLRATAIARNSNAVAFGIGLIFAAVTFGLAPQIAPILLPGSDSSTRHALEGLLRITAPLHVLWIVAVATTALANARGQFLLAAASTVVPSLPIIVALVLIPPPTVERTAAAYSIGIVAQITLLTVLGNGWGRDAVPAFSRGLIVPLVRAAAPMAIAFGFMGLSSLAVRSIASFGGPGDAASLDYATRLTTAMESVLTAGSLAVALTIWSEDAVRVGPARLPLGRAILIATALSISAAVSLIWLAVPITDVLFGNGRLPPHQIALVSSALVWLAPGLAARMVHMVGMRMLLAQRATWSITAIGLLALVGVVGGALVGRAEGGLVGVAAGYSAGWIIATVVTLLALVRIKPQLDLADARTISGSAGRP